MQIITAKNRVFYVYAFSALIFLTLTIFGYCVADKNGHLRRPAPMAGSFTTDMAYVDLPRINLQVGGIDNEAHMRVEISLEVASKDKAVMEGYQPQITDRVNFYLARLNPEQLRQPQNAAHLRAALLRLVNDIGAPVPVHDLMLRQMVVM